jgi:hypothetical protein
VPTYELLSQTEIRTHGHGADVGRAVHLAYPFGLEPVGFRVERPR